MDLPLPVIQQGVQPEDLLFASQNVQFTLSDAGSVREIVKVLLRMGSFVSGTYNIGNNFSEIGQFKNTCVHASVLLTMQRKVFHIPTDGYEVSPGSVLFPPTAMLAVLMVKWPE